MTSSSLRFAAVVAGALFASVAPACSTPEEPLRVGVLLPLSADGDMRAALEMAAENVNASGGVAGRAVELAFVDAENETDLRAAASRLAADASIRAVIGPDTSRALFEVAPIFIDANKPIVSPSATAGDIFRAFGGTKLVWRTVESDIAQVQTQLAIARRDGARTAALLVSRDDPYGSTFFDWFGFFATELGIEVTAVESWDHLADRACAPHVERVRSGDPDVVIAVPSDPATAVCVRRAFAGSPRPRVLFSDMATRPGVLAELGAEAEGMEGTVGVTESSDFDRELVAKTGDLAGAAVAYAGRAYDAFLLVAYGLARSRGAGGMALADGIADVVSGRGAPTTWDRAGIADTLAALERGEQPNVNGTAGALDFDEELFTDLVSSTYGLWRVRGGRYEIEERLSTARDGGTASIYRSFASDAHAQALAFAGGVEPPPRTGLRALVVATTRGWDNYRHQADALAVYQKLRAGGVADDRIVLVLANDLAGAPENREPGVVRHEPGGPNLFAGAEVDYALADLATGDLWSILRSGSDPGLPFVLGATEGDDVLIYVSGHAGPLGVEWQGSSRTGSALVPEALADAIEQMPARRRVLVVVDTCFAGAMAEAIERRQLPGVMVLASSRPHESTLATHWDPKLETWLADEFTSQLVRVDASQAIADVYRMLYLRVPGSHVSVYNASRFADTREVRLGDFVGR